MSSILVQATCALLLATTCLAPAQNQNKGKSQSTQQAKQELEAAKDKLKDANADLSKAEKDLEKAKAAHSTAETKIIKARAAAIAEHGKKLGLPVAIAQRDAALRSVEAAQTALTKELRAQSDHQALSKEAEQASARLQSLREDQTLTEEKRKQLTAELSKTIRRPAELERERIEADAGIQTLRAKVTEAGRQVAAVQAQAQKASEEDSDVKSALQAERDAAEKLKTARSEVDKHKKEVAAAQKKTAAETQQFQKAQSQAKGKKGKNDK